MAAAARQGPSSVERLDGLYREEAPRALRLAYLITGDRSLAEDVVHDAFLKVAGRIGALRNPDAFGAYLRRTVVNLVHNHYRHQKVVRAYLEREAKRPVETSQATDFETRDAVWRAVQGLPRRRREVLVVERRAT